MASREWACKAYCISAAIDNLSAKVTAKVTDQKVKSYQWEDSTQTQKILRQRTEDLVRLKGLLVSVIQRYVFCFCLSERKTFVVGSLAQLIVCRIQLTL